MTAGKDIEEAFQVTSKLVFGKALEGLDNYENWLTKRVPKGRMKPSCMNGKMIYVPEYAAYRMIPEEKVADAKSFTELSQRKIDLDENKTETISSLSQKMGKISTFITEFEEGTNLDVVESTIYLNLAHAYRLVDCFHSKSIAYSFFSDNCDHAFGVSKSFNCNFCIKAHDSNDCVRSFEVDFSGNCSDVMFCHNVNNVHSSLFCFNTKNLRYAIANTVVGKEAYDKARKLLCDYLYAKLAKEKKLDIDIYNVGGKA